MSKSKAIKVTDEETIGPLSTFTKNLGIQKPIDVYLYENQAYIDSDVVFKILSVSKKDFLKTSLIKVHYIKIIENIFLSKYGLTKVLGQSREKVSFLLQDYIYELMYKLEKHKTIHIDQIESKKILEEYNTKEFTVNSEKEISVLKDTLENLEAEYSALTYELTVAKKKMKSQETDYNNLFNVAKKIVKYLRTNGSKTEGIKSELFDSDSEEDSVTKEEALKCKKIIQSCTTKSISTTQKLYYLLQSSKSTIDDSGEKYSWKIQKVNATTNSNYEESITKFKEKSNEIRLTGVFDDMEYIYYVDLYLTEINAKKLTKILSSLQELTIDQVQTLVENL